MLQSNHFIKYLMFVLILGFTLLNPKSVESQATLVNEYFQEDYSAGLVLFEQHLESDRFIRTSNNGIIMQENGKYVHKRMVSDVSDSDSEIRGEPYVRFQGSLIISNGSSLIKYNGEEFELIFDGSLEQFPSDIRDIRYMRVYDDGNSSELYFTAQQGNFRNGDLQPHRLWRYDGDSFEPAFGTSSEVEYEDPAHLMGYDDGSGNKLYFTAIASNDTEEIFVYDGTEVTALDDDKAYDVTEAELFSTFDDGSGEKLYLNASKSDVDGERLFTFDGSEFNTIEGYPNITGSSDLTFYGRGADRTMFMITSEGLLEFKGESVSKIAEDIEPLLHFYNNELYFVYEPTDAGVEVGVYDQESVETAFTFDDASTDTELIGFVNFDDGDGEKLYFRKLGYLGAGTLYSFDGSSLVPQFESVDLDAFEPTRKTVRLGDRIYFYSQYEKEFAGDEANLMYYDGDTAQVVQEIDNNFTAGTGPDNESDMIQFKNQIIFTAATDSIGEEVWTYDGESTELLEDFDTYEDFGSFPGGFIKYDDGNGIDLYFNTAEVEGDKVLRYDGSEVTTVVTLEDNGYSLENAIVYDNKIYFTHFTDAAGEELWVFDGSDFSMVRDLEEGEDDSDINSFEVFDDGTGEKLYFNANANDKANELWSYDGENFTLEADIHEGNYNSSIDYITTFNDGSSEKLFFQAYKSGIGGELWSYDGQDSMLVSNITGDSQSSDPRFLTSYYGSGSPLLVFSAETDQFGRELYVYDGNSTQLVSDINQGSESSNPMNFKEFDGELYFTAYTQENGREPHVYDGSEVRLYDLRNGGISGFGVNPTIFDDGTGQRLYVTGRDGTNGFELYSFGPDDDPFSDISTSTEQISETQPENISLKANYPNPFNPATKISFELPERMNVTLAVYDILGRKVRTLTNGIRQAGNHSVTFNASGLASGVYLYRLRTDQQSFTKKMLLLK